MHCFDKEKIRLYGDYVSMQAQTLSLVFELCDPEVRTTCKDKETVTEWLKGKYLLTIENAWVFRQDSYDNKKLTAESSM